MPYLRNPFPIIKEFTDLRNYESQLNQAMEKFFKQFFGKFEILSMSIYLHSLFLHIFPQKLKYFLLFVRSTNYLQLKIILCFLHRSLIKPKNSFKISLFSSGFSKS